jgi:hypothetical protein
MFENMTFQWRENVYMYVQFIYPVHILYCTNIHLRKVILAFMEKWRMSREK